MDGHGRSTTASVAELRLRLYRPEPPVGAVGAYLAALAALPEPPPTPRAAPARRRRRALAAVLAVACTVVAVGAAMQVGRSATLPEAPAAEATRPAGRLEAPPLTGVPLGDLFGAGPGSGTFDARGNRVVASVLCRGSGTIELRMAGEPPTILTCVAATSGLALIASTAPLDRFTITVRPSAGVRWSLAAGALVD